MRTLNEVVCSSSMGPGDFSPWKPRGSGKRDDVEWGAVENDRGVFQNNYFVFQNDRFSVFKETMLSEVLSKMTVVCSKITILCSKMTDFLCSKMTDFLCSKMTDFLLVPISKSRWTHSRMQTVTCNQYSTCSMLTVIVGMLPYGSYDWFAWVVRVRSNVWYV